MAGIYVDIKTKSGVFRVKKPVGRIGAIHFGIITKYIQGGDSAEISPAQRAGLGDGFTEWSAKVFPQIFTSFTEEGQAVASTEVHAEDVSGEDQFAIFSALMSLIEVSQDYFQIINK
jgi:hypothetical protein